MNRFFLVGCPRSGTTLLQSLLAAHPEFVSFPESHFFQHLRPYATWRKHLGLARPSIRDHLREFFNLVGCKDDLVIRPGPFTHRMKDYVRAFTRSLDNIAIAHGANCWLEKTPIHLHHITLIERLVDDTQFIHMVRDGREVVASMHEVTHNNPKEWGGARDAQECLRRWMSDIECTRRHSEKSAHHVVHYRSLTTDPEGTLERLCSALDITYVESMIYEYPQKAEEVSRDFEKWKKSSTQDIEYRGLNKFRDRFEGVQKSNISESVLERNMDDITTIY